MAVVALRVGDRVPVGFDPRGERKQLCRTSGVPFAWCLKPSAVASLAVDREGALALAVEGPDRVFVVASAEALPLVETAKRTLVPDPDPDDLVAKVNIRAVLAWAALK